MFDSLSCPPSCVRLARVFKMNSETCERNGTRSIFSRGALGHQEWRRLSWGGLAVALAATLLGSACQSPPDPSRGEGVGEQDDTPPMGQLESTIGAVTLERVKGATWADLGYVFQKDVLETKEDSRATLRLPGNHLVEIGPQSRMAIGEDKGGLFLRVVRGSIIARCSGEPPGDLDFWGPRSATAWVGIQTPYGAARVPPGRSEVSVAVLSDFAQVNAIAGTVEVISRSGQVTPLEKGGHLRLNLMK